MVSVGDVSGAPWSLRAAPGLWRLEPIGLGIVPVGLSTEELHGLQDILDRADEPLVDPEVDAPVTASDESAVVEAAGPYVDVPWSLMVRLLGPVDVIDPPERPARFERSKTLELIAWLTLHRDRSTRAGARTALWDLDVRDATFANVVSEARSRDGPSRRAARRRGMARQDVDGDPSVAQAGRRRRRAGASAGSIMHACSRPNWRSRRCGQRLR